MDASDTLWGKAEPAGSPQTPHAASDTRIVPIKKADDDEQIVFGEVYAPAPPDSHGDFMSAEEVKKTAYDFMQRGLTSNIDIQHSREQSGCFIVESFIAREDDPLFIPGSWVIGVKVPDPDVWSMVKSGELNGFSFDGIGIRVDTVMTLIVPEVIKGETEETDGHVHTFFVKYDLDGQFIGGRTDEAADGHFHEIRRGTATETSEGHSHRFSFIEGVIDARAEG